MTRAQKTLIILIVAGAGLWGCSQGEQKSAGSHDKRLKALEAKIDSLASECQCAQQAREEMEKQLAELRQENERLHKQIELARRVVQERDDLKTTVSARTQERDLYQTQLQELQKGMRSLLSHVESCLPHSEDSGQKTSMAPKY